VVASLDVLISGDSGPVHVAGALGTPSVVVFGPTSPLRWGPLSADSEVIWGKPDCAPCSNHGDNRCPRHETAECMAEVKTAGIVEAVERVCRTRSPQ